MDVNMLRSQESTDASLSHINAFQSTKPKRAIKGQQHLQQGPSPPYASNYSAPTPSNYGAPTPSTSDQNKAIANLQRQVSGLANQFTALMSKVSADNHSTKPNDYRQYQQRSQNYSTRQNDRSAHAQVRTFPTPLEYTFDGKPICLFCKNPGHVKKDCRKKAAADARRFQGGR